VGAYHDHDRLRLAGGGLIELHDVPARAGAACGLVADVSPWPPLALVNLFLRRSDLLRGVVRVALTALSGRLA